MYKLSKLLRSGIVLGLSAITLFSCKGKDGEPGPRGDAGAGGPAGVQGQPGVRPGSRVKQGFVTGAITGFRQDGVTPLNETFRYEFTSVSDLSTFSSVRETKHAGVYDFAVQRGDSLDTQRFTLRFRAPLTLAADTVISTDIRFSRNLSNSQVLGVDGNYYQYNGRPQVVKLTNLAYNPQTGMLAGDYVYNAVNENVGTSTMSYSSSTGSGKPFTVTGSFNVQVPMVTSFRMGARQ
jgi:hypothetical protein